MKSYNSIWTWGYSKRYYLTHPWKWFKDLGHNIRDAYRRARYGWTYVDVWNWDNWFLHIAPEMFRHLAENGCGYPGFPPFNGPYGYQRWQEWLREVASLLESGTEDWQDAHNEYYEEYMKHLMDNWEPPIRDENGFLRSKTPEQTELQERYFARQKELSEEGEKNVQHALSEISKYFYSLWD